MRRLNFIHLSDTHIRENYAGTMMENIAANLGRTPDELLSLAADEVKAHYPMLDFAVISGDLTHEGSAQDYAHFRSLLRHHFGEIEIYVCLGNHDRYGAFMEGFLKEPDNGDSYYYDAVHGDTGLRIIALDSNSGGNGGGLVSDSQLVWLKETLREKAKAGTIIILHHPPYPIEDPHDMRSCYRLINTKALYEIIQDSDVFAILSGHTHNQSAGTLGHIPHYTAGSTAFGNLLTAEYMIHSDRLGFSYCTIEDRQITVSHVALNSGAVNGARITMADLGRLREEYYRKTLQE